MDQAIRRKFQVPDRPMFIGLVSLGKGEYGTWLEPQRMKALDEAVQEIKTSPLVSDLLAISNVNGAADVDARLTSAHFPKSFRRAFGKTDYGRSPF